MFNPIRYAGTRPTSDNTEYLPPIKFLCSIKKRLNFFDNSYKVLFFFSVIIIIFLEFFLMMFNEIKFEIVSIVLPDFEIIKIKFFVIFFLF